MIVKLLNEILDNYLDDKRTFFSSPSPRNVGKYITYDRLVNKFPTHLYEDATISSNEYLIKGSISNGNLAHNPWIAIFDRQITESAQHGFYIVFLFKSDMSGFYLSLNQGWTQYEQNFEGRKQQNSQISKITRKVKSLLKSTDGFSKDEIDLLAVGDLGKGYQKGNICSKYYSKNDLPEEYILINDIRNLIGVYRELKGIIGLSILDIDKISSEEVFQNEIQTGVKVDVTPGKTKIRNKISIGGSWKWVRDPNVAYTALLKAEFKCEYDQSHQTFISKKSRKQFMEAHHLIPMEFQDEFESSIDIPDNIISLCPTCHRAIHHSTINERLLRIEFHLKTRINSLTKNDIKISGDQILKYYEAIEEEAIS